MPIAGYAPTPPQGPQLPEEKETFETQIIDNAVIPEAAIIPFIEGSRWTVDYWHQHLDADDTLTGFDPNLTDTLQQYVWIAGMVLHVTSPLSNEVDQNGITVAQTGTALYYNTIPPYVGDVFAVELLDNTIGLFKITEVSRKSYSKRTVYEISYTSFMFITDKNDPVLKQLGQKTIRKYYYEEENFFQGNSPLLTSEDKQTKVIIQKRYYELANWYVVSMLDRPTKMLIIPGQDYRVYDHNLQNFVFKTISTDVAPMLNKVYRASPNTAFFDKETLFDLLVQRSIFMLGSVSRDIRPVHVSYAGCRTVTRSLEYAGVDYAMLPVDAVLATDDDELFTSSYVLKPSPNDSYAAGTTPDTNIPNVFSDTAYVFTNDFYQDNANLTPLETQVLNYLRGDAVDRQVLVELSEKALTWEHVSQFYYVPILLYLIRAEFEGMSSVY